MTLIDMLLKQRSAVLCLRMNCRSRESEIEFDADGVIAVAAIHGNGGAATLLLADMWMWGRRGPATLGLTAAIDEYVKAAYQLLIAPRGIPLDRVRIVEWDSRGNFDFFVTAVAGGYLTHVPVFGLSRASEPRSRDALLSWTGATGAGLLARVESAMGGPMPADATRS